MISMIKQSTARTIWDNCKSAKFRFEFIRISGRYNFSGLDWIPNLKVVAGLIHSCILGRFCYLRLIRTFSELFWSGLVYCYTRYACIHSKRPPGYKSLITMHRKPFSSRDCFFSGHSHCKLGFELHQAKPGNNGSRPSEPKSTQEAKLLSLDVECGVWRALSYQLTWTCIQLSIIYM